MNDYHTHTSFSEDSETPMEQMLEKAYQLGLKQLAVTDHYDPDFPDDEWTFDLDFDNYWQALCENEDRFKDKIELVKGIEIGILPGDTLAKCRDTAEMFPYDLVIGSFHAFNGYDLDRRNFEGMEKEEIIPRFYSIMYDCLRSFHDFDIIGHFNIIDRYLDFKPDYSGVRDLIAEILKILIDEDKSIELNTSSYRYGMGERTHASKDILMLYRDLGGRNVTISSDAHKPEQIALEFGKARDILRSAGFERLSVYKGRQRSEISF
jgi:histidinol phosphate phosphatase HisJ family